MEPTIGYVVIEPNLDVERVPDRLLGWQDILWPANRNQLQPIAPGEPAPFFSANELYHRHMLRDTTIAVFVRNRDPDALPQQVTQTILERAAEDAARR